MRPLYVFLYVFFFSILMLTPGLRGQHGSAPNGYYPMGYSGDTFTGQVANTNDSTREIFLHYEKENKSEDFSGVLEPGYKVEMKNGTEHELKVSEIPIGTRLTAFYMKKERKENGKKIKYNNIFKVLFVLPDQKKL